MSELKTYTGGCHCGKVRYEVQADLSAPVIACNCSMCGRSATLLTFVPPQQFTLKSGEDVLSDYLFNKHQIHHLFCRVCGIKSFARGAGPQGPMIAINARCLDGVEPEQLNVTRYDGRNQ
jgi:hypothetical protein